MKYFCFPLLSISCMKRRNFLHHTLLCLLLHNFEWETQKKKLSQTIKNIREAKKFYALDDGKRRKKLFVH